MGFMINFRKFNSIYELTSYFNSENKCRKAIFESRWNKDDVICPFCGQHHCTSRTDGRFHCSQCKSNFSVTVGSFTTNGIEGFWGHFKRVIFGTYHFVSKTYLERYIDEAIFRFNTKELKESDRFSHMFEKAIGNCYYKDVKMYA